MSDFLDQLNEPQRQATVNIDGPVMILAGAGSGKTRVITYRMAYMIQKGIDPFNILALTFTNKAAKEMKDRVEKIMGSALAKNLWLGTFHSVFAKILRIESEKLGYPSNFTIYDTDDSKNLIKSIVKEMGLDDKQYKPNLIYSRISSCKNNLISWRTYQRNDDLVGEDRKSSKPMMGTIFQTYQERLFKSSAMDFDDLLFNTNILFRDFPEILHKYQHKFRYIMVDEYQDTNFSQYIIVKKLASTHENICVVGDDAQSIYAFRGANIENILNFKKDYPDLKVFKLEQNYRSTKVIVNAANSVIAKNKNQFHKAVWTHNEEGKLITVSRAFTDNEEGQLVANSIFDTRLNESAKNDDFAILYRTNAQSRSMEEALRKRNIPYKIYGGLSFYKRKEIKDLIAYFRMSVNPHDEEALRRIINYPARGIGDSTLEKIIISATSNGKSIWEVLSGPELFKIDINKGIQAKLLQFAELIKGFGIIAGTMNAWDAANHIATHSRLMHDLYNDKTPEGVSRYENIQELMNGIKEFIEDDLAENKETADGQSKEQPEARMLADYLQDIALFTDADEDKESKDKVSLMTIHAAKGLEFPYVYIVGLEENLFPSQLTNATMEDLEEERRLFYVALTRAEKKAMLSFANTRYRWGQLVTCEPSRFIKEIDEKFLDFKYVNPGEGIKSDFLSDTDDWGSSFHLKRNTAKFSESAGTSNRYEKPVSNGPKNLPGNFKKLSQTNSALPAFQGDDTSRLKEGMQVEHQRFGKGTVSLVEGVFPNQKATILFQEAGTKQLILKFARLKILA